jgi:hypothetical protein
MLYNFNSTFKLDFQNPQDDNNILWKYYKQAVRNPSQTTYHLYDQCKVVIIMGCRAIYYITQTLNIQRIVSRNGNKPLILGFYYPCPTEQTEHLVTFFVQELATSWDSRFEKSHIIASWLRAARQWKYLPYRRNIGYIDNDGIAYKIRITGETWEWESVPRK